MECFFMLISNESSKTSFWEKLIWGVYQLPFRCGIAASLRLLQVSDHVDRIEEMIMKDHPKFLHLMRMVVDPLKQGQGYHVLMYLSVQCSKYRMFLCLDLSINCVSIFLQEWGAAVWVRRQSRWQIGVNCRSIAARKKNEMLYFIKNCKKSFEVCELYSYFMCIVFFFHCIMYVCKSNCCGL